MNWDNAPWALVGSGALILTASFYFYLFQTREPVVAASSVGVHLLATGVAMIFFDELNRK